MAASAAMAAAPAAATENRLELWLNPSVAVDIGERTFIELETAQRFRAAPADDTYFVRLWLGGRIANDVTVSGGVEQRFEGGGRENRLLQQLAYPLGPLSARTRLEQRFIEDEPQTAWRLRQRIGGSVPLGPTDGGWHLTGEVEGFFTLQASAPGDQTGLTAVRSFVGFEREFAKVAVSVGYLRQQTIRDNAADTIGHAPFVGLGISY